MKIIFIMVMGCRLANQGRELDEDTKNRCKAALREYQRITATGRQCFFVLTAGMAINKDDYPVQTQTMAEIMKNYFCQSGITQDRVLVSADTTVWGSKAEIKEAAMITASKQPEPSVLVVSSWYHIPRLWIVCLKQSTHIKWGFAASSKSGRFKDVLWEIVKFFGELLNVKRRLT